MESTNMSDIQEHVLENVDEDKSLFEKELRKSFNWLDYEDLIILYDWAKEQYNEKYFNLINGMFLGFGYIVSNSHILVSSE